MLTGKTLSSISPSTSPPTSSRQPHYPKVLCLRERPSDHDQGRIVCSCWRTHDHGSRWGCSHHPRIDPLRFCSSWCVLYTHWLIETSNLLAGSNANCTTVSWLQASPDWPPVLSHAPEDESGDHMKVALFERFVINKTGLDWFHLESKRPGLSKFQNRLKNDIFYLFRRLVKKC